MSPSWLQWCSALQLWSVLPLLLITVENRSQPCAQLFVAVTRTARYTTVPIPKSQLGHSHNSNYTPDSFCLCHHPQWVHRRVRAPPCPLQRSHTHGCSTCRSGHGRHSCAGSSRMGSAPQPHHRPADNNQLRLQAPLSSSLLSSPLPASQLCKENSFPFYSQHFSDAEIHVIHLKSIKGNLHCLGSQPSHREYHQYDQVIIHYY